MSITHIVPPLHGIEVPMSALVTGLIEGGHIKDNSWGMSIWTLERSLPGSVYTAQHAFGNTKPGAEHDLSWYIENADGKGRISAETGLDSLIVARTNPGLLPLTGNMFPWGGAVIDVRYGVIVSTSGFAELQDVGVSKACLNLIIMKMDMLGLAELEDARERATGAQPEDRMTQAA